MEKFYKIDYIFVDAEQIKEPMKVRVPPLNTVREFPTGSWILTHHNGTKEIISRNEIQFGFLKS